MLLCVHLHMPVVCTIEGLDCISNMGPLHCHFVIITVFHPFFDAVTLVLVCPVCFISLRFCNLQFVTLVVAFVSSQLQTSEIMSVQSFTLLVT